MVEEGAWVKIFTKKDNSLIGVWHHGIITSVDKDDNAVSVIHFCADPDDRSGPKAIRETRIDWFYIDGTNGQVVDEVASFSNKEIVHRARKEVGKGNYNASFRNCQHFASWCYRGRSSSEQVAVIGISSVLMIASMSIFAVLAMAYNPWN